MKKTLLFAGLLLALFHAVKAQTPSTQSPSAIYYAANDYTLRYANDSGDIGVTLLKIFDGNAGTFKLALRNSGGGWDSLMTLRYPLDYDFFYKTFADSLHKLVSTSKALSDGSVRQLFYDLYLLAQGENDGRLTIARLCLRRWIYLFGDKDDESVADYALGLAEAVKERGERIDQITNDYQAAEFGFHNARNDLLDALTVLRLPNSLTEMLAANVREKRSIVAAKENSLASAQAQVIAASTLLGAAKGQMRAAERGIRDTQAKLKAARDSAVNGKDEARKKQAELDTTSLAKELERLQAALKKSSEDSGAAAKQTKEKETARVPYQTSLDEARTALQKAEDSLLIEEAKERERAGSPIVLARMIAAVRNGSWTDTADYEADADKVRGNTPLDTIDSLARNYFAKRAALFAKQQQLRKDHIYRINRVSIQFERGYIERIQVYVDNGKHGEYLFENSYAIGITSVQNLKNLAFVRLFHRPNLSKNRIVLADVFTNYNNMLAQFTRDYSPADTVMNDISPMSDPCIFLKKEHFVRLLDAKLFTDLQGLRADQPNGLVQIEAQRRFNINTRRNQIGYSRANRAYFNHLTAYGALTKVEQEQRYLPLRNAGIIRNGVLVSPNYATTLDLRQYENFNLGLDVNLLLFDKPDQKFTFYLNTGLRYGHTPLMDSIRRVRTGGTTLDTPGRANPLDAHSFTWALPRASLELFSERRVGLTLSYEYNFVRQYTNNNFKPVMSYAKSDVTALTVERMARFYHVYEFFLRVETSQDYNSRLFLRARYFMQRGDVNTFFPQIQLGYAYNLLYRK